VTSRKWGGPRLVPEGVLFQLLGGGKGFRGKERQPDLCVGKGESEEEGCLSGPIALGKGGEAYGGSSLSV